MLPIRPNKCNRSSLAQLYRIINNWSQSTNDLCELYAEPVVYFVNSMGTTTFFGIFFIEK